MNDFHISKIDRIYIGILIKHLRKLNYNKSKSQRFTQEKFIYYNDSDDNICSRKTLISIENGKTVEDLFIYENLLEKFSLKYKYDLCIDDLISDNDFFSLMENIDFYRVDEVITLLKEKMGLIKKYYRYVIFHEHYLLLKMLLNYYEKMQLISKDEIELIKHISPFLNNHFKEAIYDLVFKSEIRHDHYDLEYLEIHSLYSVTNRMNFIQYLIHGKNIMYAQEQIHSLKDDLIQNNNYSRLLDIYNVQLALCSPGDHKYFLDIVRCINDMIKSHKKILSNNKLAQTYKNLGMCAFKLRQWDCSREYILKFLEIDNREPVPYIIILINIYEIYENHKEIDDLLNIEVCLENKYSIMLSFYYLKFKCNYQNSNLLIYIIKQIAPLLTRYDETYIKIFRHEIYKIMETCPKYKYIKDYDFIIRNNIRSQCSKNEKVCKRECD